MTDKNDLERRVTGYRLMLATGVSAMALGLGAPAFAQQTTDQAADDAVDSEELITVTGSRIKRAGLDTVRPAITIDTESLDKRAFTNIADALNEVPAFGNGITPDGGQNAFTVGQNFVNLFNLGTQRTLVLVDGKRFVSSNVPVTFGSAGGLQVDLNSVPVALIDRIEVVPLAGAATYGSDAIAGTVNVILRDDYEGFEASGQYGVAEKGDFQTYQAQVVFGANTPDGRGNTTLSVEYADQQGGLLNKRDRFFANDPNLVNFGSLDLNGDGVLDDVDGDGDPDTFRRVFFDQTVQLFGPGGSVSPGTLTIPSIGLGTLADGNFYQFNPDSTLSTCTPGTSPGRSSLFFAQGGSCGIDFFDSVAQIRSPLERIVISSTSHYDLTPGIRFNLQTTFANAKANELVNQGGFQTFAFGGTSGALTFNTDNPFLSSQARGILEGNGLTSFGLNRFNNDIVNSGANSTENFTWRLAGGFEGDFEAAGRNFNWSIDAVFGESDVETRQFGIVDGRFLNAIDAVLVDDALLQQLVTSGTATDLNDALNQLNRSGRSGVSGIDRGDIICQVNADIAAGTVSGFNAPATGNGVSTGIFSFAEGCVPLNLFGEGAGSPEAIAFINGSPRITSSDIAQRVFTGSFGGDAIQLPAGWAAFNVGFETRRERAVFTPGLGTALDITRSSPFIETGGQTKTYEVFGEVLIPLVSADMGIPGFEMLEATGSFRRVNNRVANVDRVKANSTTVNAYEFGGRWSPVKDIIVRGSYASAIRAPSLVELFSPRVQAFLFASDPCDERFINGGPSPAVRAANCAAVGITQPFTSNVVNASIIGANEGNPALQPERSKSYNIGGVVRPRWVPNLNIQLDYFNIKIKDRIVGLGLTDIMSSCFDSTSFPNNPFCSPDLFRRDASGQVVFGKTTSLNASQSNFEAFQVQASYNFDVADALNASKLIKAGGDLGELAFNLNVFKVFGNSRQTLDVTPVESKGTFADPQYSGTLDTTYSYGPWRAFWRVVYQDGPVFSALSNSFVLDDNDQIVEFGARVIHNASLAYTVNDGTTIQLGVNNVTKRLPNTFEQAAGYFGTTEQLGRTYTLRVRSQF